MGDSFWGDSTCAQKCTCTSLGLQCQNQPCSFSQICQPSDFQFSCQTVQRGTCTITGDPHYYTFDNRVFHSQGTCTYAALVFLGHDWSKCMSIMKPLTTPFFLNNNAVQVYQSGFSVIVSTNFGLEVSYDTNHLVRIRVPYTYHNATCGLCGNFNGIRQDDFRTPQGEIVSSDVVFTNSWRASGEDEPGCEPECEGLECPACTEDQTDLYSNNDHCGILQNSSGPFATCHQRFPPQPFVESCVFDLCVAGGYQPILCEALNTYASQCQQNGIQLPSWRSEGFCEISCPTNSHFESQGTGCPATCVNPNAPQNCPLPDQESCICNSSYILSAGVCVPHAECGCSFEGQYYRSGETVILDEDCGRHCRCSYGSMSCTPHGCSPGSYHTFDGVTYQYPGACRLTLAKVMGSSRNPHFMVTAEKVPRGQQGFARLLNFEAEGVHVSIEMASSSRVQVSDFHF
uniref:VWFD domain-containing protein n=1 Tax=Mola mola TaxID=94237 RepID=A0A3Q3WZY4_MOLML